MKLDTKYIDTKKIISCEILAHEYQSGKEWHIQISGVNCGASLKFKNEKEAIDAFNQIMLEIEANSNQIDKEKDYIQGFKDGTEYALKISKKAD